MSSGPWEQYQNTSPAPEGPWSAYQSKPTQAPSVAEDVAKTVPAGLARGAAGLAGLPADAANLVDRIWQYGVSKGLETVGIWTPEQAEKARQPLTSFERDAQYSRMGLPTSKTYVDATEKAVGPLYKPQTTAGEYVNTAAEFAPGMLLAPGSIAQRAAQTFIPAVVSETAGQVARHIAPSAEPYIRGGAAILSGALVSAAQRPTSASAAIRETVGDLDPAIAGQVQTVIDDAASQGVRLSLDEAMAFVNGGRTPLTDMRRVVGNTPGGRQVMGDFDNARPGQVQQAGNAAIADLAPQPMNPIETGIRVQRAAAGEIDDTQRAINNATRPQYQAIEATRIDPAAQTALAADPLYMQTLREIRGRPDLNRTVAHLPDDSVGVVDMVQRRMREASDNARVPGQASTSNTASMNYADARTPAIDAADAATGGHFRQVLGDQAQLRAQHLEPLQRGPMGAVAGADDVMGQARALLPEQPVAGIDQMVSQTVRRIVRREPEAASNLVRTYAQTVFDEATQALKSGPNVDGGAKFAAKVVGNPQQARNLEAAVRALPNGHVRWEGFRRFLDTLEATGYRPETGSRTAFNAQDMKALSGGGIVSEGVQAAKTGGVSLVQRLNERYQQYRLGQNSQQLAEILTSPEAGRILGQILREPAGSAKAQALALRLTYFGNTVRQQSEANPVR